MVRRGLAAHLPGRRIIDVRLLHPRTLRRFAGGPADFADGIRGRTLGEPHRRGKYLWIPLEADDAITLHLGMSGQCRLDQAADPLDKHTRVVLDLDDGSSWRFVDQRTFGWMTLSRLVDGLPAEVTHIARDLLDPELDEPALCATVHASTRGIKRLLLDQRVVSGVGNIYADEALWRSALHYAQPGSSLSCTAIRSLLDAARAVMAAALAAGGTSFDPLYVDVNGRSGYFDRDLAVYGRADKPCFRCGTAIVREPFMNRSSFRCPDCQRLPKNLDT